MKITNLGCDEFRLEVGDFEIHFDVIYKRRGLKLSPSWHGEYGPIISGKTAVMLFNKMHELGLADFVIDDLED